MYPNKSATLTEEQRRGKLSYRSAATIATPRADDDFVPETEEEAEAAAAAEAETAEAEDTEATIAAAAASSSPIAQVHLEEHTASPVGLMVEPPTSPVASPGLLLSSPLGGDVSPSRWPTHSPSTRAQWGAWRAFKALRRQVSSRLASGSSSSKLAVPSPVKAEGTTAVEVGTPRVNSAAEATVHAAARTAAPEYAISADASDAAAAPHPTPVAINKPLLPVFIPIPASSMADTDPAPTATPTASAFSARGGPGSSASLASRMAQRRKQSFERRRAGREAGAAGAGSARGVKAAVARGLAFAGMGSSRDTSPNAKPSPNGRAVASTGAVGDPGDERA